MVVAVGAAGEAGGLGAGAAAEDTLPAGGRTRGIDDGNRRKRRTNMRAIHGLRRLHSAAEPQPKQKNGKGL